MTDKFEYCTINWIWSDSDIRAILPDGDEISQQGGHKEITQLLNNLGLNGWNVVSCVAVSNWIYWTLKRSV
jgi:hypothetical protein